MQILPSRYMMLTLIRMKLWMLASWWVCNIIFRYNNPELSDRRQVTCPIPCSKQLVSLHSQYAYYANWRNSSRLLATWKVSYSARNTYGPLVDLKPTEPLSPAFWHRVTEAFVANDTAFQQYIFFKTRGIGGQVCSGNCKTTTICDLRALRAENNCVCQRCRRSEFRC